MKHILFALIIPAFCYAQTPTPTLDPDVAVAERFGMSVLDFKLQRLQQAMQEIRSLKRADLAGKVGTSEDVQFDLTNEQKQTLRQARRSKIQALRQACRDLSDDL